MNGNRRYRSRRGVSAVRSHFSRSVSTFLNNASLAFRLRRRSWIFLLLLKCRKTILRRIVTDHASCETTTQNRKKWGKRGHAIREEKGVSGKPEVAKWGWKVVGNHATRCSVMCEDDSRTECISMMTCYITVAKMWQTNHCVLTCQKTWREHISLTATYVLYISHVVNELWLFHAVYNIMSCDRNCISFATHGTFLS